MMFALGCAMLESCAVKPTKEKKVETAREAVTPETPAEEAATPVAPPIAKTILRAAGTKIVDGSGQPVILKGCNLGNWLLLEMWMLAIHDIRDQYEFESILTERFGEAEKDRLMDLYRANWICERDFPIIRSFGFNTVRLPFNYRLLEDDAKPFQLKPDAFQWLDHTIDLATKYGLYVILDMHGVPGGQSTDHTTGRAGENKLWLEENRLRTAWLWKEIANHYKDSPVVAAYDVINEPFGDYRTFDHQPALVDVFDRIYKSIRMVDTNHLIFAPGTHQGIEFYGAPKDHGWQNVGFTEHFYPGLFGSEPSVDTHALFIVRHIPWRAAYLDKMQTPFLVGEFNVVFGHLGGGALMRRYFDVYAEQGWAATMWSYKLLGKDPGIGEDSWCMVKNEEPPPVVNIRTSSEEEIESYFKWLGTMPYAVYRNLGAALTAKMPPPVRLPEYASLPVEPPARDPLTGWQATDINGASPGGQKVISDSAMDIYAGGDDIWKTNDQFRFTWKQVNGDFDLTAMLKSLTHSHDYAKGGLMVRGSLDADAPHFMITAFPNGEIALAWRAAKGGNTEQKIVKQEMFPVYLRLRRRGDMLEAAYSIDGQNWEKTKIQESGQLGRNSLVGFAVLSHYNRGLVTASFENIRLVSGPAARRPTER